jgi:NAD(P)-dependent dehydrogenase (short-subunit alcohol dehydrogenase family)
MVSVVVTGGTKGIGNGLARAFLARGHSVCVSGRDAAEVDAVVTELARGAREGAEAIGAVCDTRDPAAVQALWDRAAAAFGSVDIWINNAGFAPTGVTLLDLTPDEIRTMIESNVMGTINGAQVAVRGMTAQGKGRIYNMLGGGQDGRVLPGMIGYGTTKRALRYFTDCMVLEQKGTPVKVGMISPGLNVSEGLLRELRALAPERRARMMRPINLLGDLVDTTTPWIADRILADTGHGTHIRWMGTGKILGRLVASVFRKRDLFAHTDLAIS